MEMQCYQHETLSCNPNDLIHRASKRHPHTLLYRLDLLDRPRGRRVYPTVHSPLQFPFHRSSGIDDAGLELVLQEQERSSDGVRRLDVESTEECVERG